MRGLIAIILLGSVVFASAQESNEPIALTSQAAQAIDVGRPVDALRILRKAQESATAGSDPRKIGAVGVGFGALYLSLSEFDRAKRYFAEALPHLERAGDRDGMARALIGIASVDLLGTRYRTAEDSLEKARTLGGSPDTLATTLTLISELRARSGQLTEARELIATARRESTGDIASLRASIQEARLAARASDYREAMQIWTTLLPRARAMKLPRDIADAQASLGELNFQLGLVTEAKPRFEEALQEYLRIGNRAGEARMLVRLSRVEQRISRPDRALQHAERAIELARKRHDYVTEAEALTELAEIWSGEPIPQMIALPNEAVSIRHLRAAREIYKDAGDRGAGANVLLRTAVVHLRLKQYRTAALTFEFVGRTAKELGDEDLYWQALRGEAAALAGEGKLEPAARKYEAAIAALEAIYLRTAGLAQEARASFLGDRRGIYEEYVEVLVRLRGSSADASIDALAFAAAERAKSRQFTEMLAAGGAERAVAAGEPALRTLAQREKSIRADLAELQRALLLPGAQSGEAPMLSERITRLRRDHDSLLKEIESRFPRYAELLQPKPISLTDAQLALRSGEVLLSYFVGPKVTAAFVITRERATMVPMVIPRRELRNTADQFRRVFGQVSDLNALAQWKPASAHAMYRLILEPIASFLPVGVTLLVSADDVLYTLPLEALLRSDPGTLKSDGKNTFAEYEKLDWFGDRHPVVYVPSASALRALRAEKPQTNWKIALVAFADPDFGDMGVAQARGVMRAADLKLARLPETADEVRAVSALMKGASRIHLRRDANESRVSDPELTEARYLMFSTHGLLGGEISAVNEPALALTLTGNPPGVDGFLSMSEVLGLRLTADLVALSACNTAGEPDAARVGEGFAGLTRSFMYAGARSLLVSHWPVGSQATVELITAFFRELALGRPKAVAMANARRQVRALIQDGVQLAHPFFWAPFVVVGEPH